MNPEKAAVLNSSFRGYPDSDPLPFAAGDLLDLTKKAGEQRFGMISFEFVLQSLFIADLLCKSQAEKPISSALWTFREDGALNPGLKISYVGEGTPVGTFTDWHVSVLIKAFEWTLRSRDHGSLYHGIRRYFNGKFPGDIVGRLSGNECINLFKEMEKQRFVRENDRFVLVPDVASSNGRDKRIVYRHDDKYRNEESMKYFDPVPKLFSPDEDLFGGAGR